MIMVDFLLKLLQLLPYNKILNFAMSHVLFSNIFSETHAELQTLQQDLNMQSLRLMMVKEFKCTNIITNFTSSPNNTTPFKEETSEDPRMDEFIRICT